jgi:hypothetical protein
VSSLSQRPWSVDSLLNVYFVVNPSPMITTDAFDLLATFGYRLRVVPEQDWASELSTVLVSSTAARPPSLPLMRLHALMRVLTTSGSHHAFGLDKQLRGEAPEVQHLSIVTRPGGNRCRLPQGRHEPVIVVCEVGTKLWLLSTTVTLPAARSKPSFFGKGGAPFPVKGAYNVI